MKTKQVLSPEVDALVRAQSGVISREQSLSLGVSRHVIERLRAEDRWRDLSRGLYAVWHPLPWLGLAWAGVILGGEGAVPGGHAAARLHRLIDDDPVTLDVWVSERHLARLDDRFRFRWGTRAAMGDPPRTRVADTLLDLGKELDEDALCALIADAVSQRRTHSDALLRALAQRERYPRRILLQEMLGQVKAGARSPLEVRYLRDVERAHGLPTGERQRRTQRGYVPDVRYDAFGLIVELDGRQFHAGSRALGDLARDIEHLVDGRVTVRLGWSQVTSSACETAAALARLMTSRGWGGLPTRCARCRLVSAA